MKTMILAVIAPSALPALRIAGALFLLIHVLAAAWAIRHWRRLFGPDSVVDGDIQATRQLQIIVLAIPWLFLTFRLAVEWVGLWLK